MATTIAAVARHQARYGLCWLSPSEGLAMLHLLLLRPMARVLDHDGVTLAARVDWGKFASRVDGRDGFFSAMSDRELCSRRATPLSFEMETSIAGDAATSNSALMPNDPASIIGAVQACLSSVLGVVVDADDSLLSLGLDSLGSLELHRELTRRFGSGLPHGLTFDNNTARSLANAIFASRPGQVQEIEIVNSVLACLSSVLGIAVDADDSLLSMGLDSLGSLELHRELTRRFGAGLPRGLAFENHSARSLANAIFASRQGSDKERVPSSEPAAPGRRDLPAELEGRHYFEKDPMQHLFAPIHIFLSL